MKNLLLLAALAATMGASAQSNYCFMTPLDGETPLAAGTVLAESENGKLTWMFDEAAKPFVPARDPYNYISVAGGEMVQITSGTTGNTNGGWTSATSLPDKGVVYQFTSTKPGFVTVITKMNSNKEYFAYRGGQEYCAFRLGFAYTDQKICYTLPHDEFDYIDMNAADIAQYINPESDKILKPFQSGPEPKAEQVGEGTGFIQFPVFEAGEVITVFAAGSKMACNGFIFTPVADGEEYPSLANCPQVVIGGVEKVNGETGEVTPAPTPVTFEGYTVAGGSSAIEDIIVDADAENAPMFNVLGQQVDASYKGLVIKNGKKFINR